MRGFLLLFISLLSTASISKAAGRSRQPENAELSAGRVIDRVATLADANQSYALFLPSNYTPSRRWPILYCFDPRARGRVPVELFSEAAEKFGWIVVGSNNSRNGPLQPWLEATQALWKDTHERLAIDEKRVYTTGFSGGARAAVRVGYLCQNCITGVIVCGGGFPSGFKPAKDVSFAIFGMVGTDDFNYPELKQLDQELEKLALPHRLAVFDGGHTWAPKGVATSAIEWMELRAMISGMRVRDDAMIEMLWKQQRDRALAFESLNNTYEALQVYQAMITDFRSLRTTSEPAKRAIELGELKDVRARTKEEKEQIDRQLRLTDELVALVEKRKVVDQRAQAELEFRRKVAAIRKQTEAAGDSGERRVARRVLNQLIAQYYEGAMTLRNQSRPEALVALNLEIALEMSPDSSGILYELACSHARAKEKKRALATLGMAIEKGFRDVERINQESAFEALRSEAEYRRIAEKLGITSSGPR